MTEDDSIDRLITQFQAGIDHEEAFRRLYHRFHLPVRSFFRRKGFPEEESLDLTQESFFRVFRALGTFRRDSRFETWLFGVVRHVYHNELRWRVSEKRSGREVSLDAFDFEGPGAVACEPGANSPEEGPLESLIEKERSEALRLALQALPDQMRVCCMLRYEQGLKYQEIAVVMKISIETVKAHLHQARKRLIATLGEEP